MDTMKIMPCFDMKAGQVVKGINFIRLKEAGDPVTHTSFCKNKRREGMSF